MDYKWNNFNDHKHKKWIRDRTDIIYVYWLNGSKQRIYVLYNEKFKMALIETKQKLNSTISNKKFEGCSNISSVLNAYLIKKKKLWINEWKYDIKKKKIGNC